MNPHISIVWILSFQNFAYVGFGQILPANVNPVMLFFHIANYFDMLSDGSNLYLLSGLKSKTKVQTSTNHCYIPVLEMNNLKQSLYKIKLRALH